MIDPTPPFQHIYLKFKDRSVWRFPAKLVAESKAHFLTDDIDCRVHRESTYEAVLLELMGNAMELLNWLNSDMNFDEIEDDLEYVEDPPRVNYADEWSEAEKWVR